VWPRHAAVLSIALTQELACTAQTVATRAWSTGRKKDGCRQRARMTDDGMTRCCLRRCSDHATLVFVPDPGIYGCNPNPGYTSQIEPSSLG
jgi:hypothetical protein